MGRTLLSISQSELCQPQIKCEDTAEISEGYFYLIRNKDEKKYSGNERLAAFAAPYFIKKLDTEKKIIDKIYVDSHSLNDTIKYLSFTPSLDNYFSHIIEGVHCAELYKRGIDIYNLIKPVFYYKVPPIDKYHKGDEIGFSYVQVKWLHLKISDYIATANFNFPYTLSQPYAKTKTYDIYIPIKILQIDNKVTVKDKKIVIKP